MTAKPISIKDTGCKSGGCVRKAVELTSGDLLFVPESGLRFGPALSRRRFGPFSKRVKANKGSAGVDGMTVQQLPEHLKQHWPAIREQLLSGTYAAAGKKGGNP
jgi:hypothetical protein